MKLRYRMIRITVVLLVFLFCGSTISVCAESSRAESAQAASVQTDSVQIDPIQAESVQTDSIQAESVQTDSVQTDSVQAESAQAAQIFLPEWFHMAAKSIDAVSSATGNIGSWMKFYARYGILTISLPYDEESHWEMYQHPVSSGQVRILQCGETEGVWYTGLQAGSDCGRVRLEFDLYQQEQLIRSLFVQVQIEGGRITSVFDYGETD